MNEYVSKESPASMEFAHAMIYNWMPDLPDSAHHDLMRFLYGVGQ